MSEAHEGLLDQVVAGGCDTESGDNIDRRDLKEAQPGGFWSVKEEKLLPEIDAVGDAAPEDEEWALKNATEPCARMHHGADDDERKAGAGDETGEMFAK